MASLRPTKADQKKSQTKEKQAPAVPKSTPESTLASNSVAGDSRKRGSKTGPKTGQPEKTSSVSSIVGDDGFPSTRESDVASFSQEMKSRETNEKNLHGHVAIRAFLLYEASGYRDGNDLEHWFEAERQVKELDV